MTFGKKLLRLGLPALGLAALATLDLYRDDAPDGKAQPPATRPDSTREAAPAASSEPGKDAGAVAPGGTP